MSEEEAKTEETPAATEEEKAPEEESTATFEPVVKLEEVEVKTGTEEEETIFTKRAKLYIHGETLLDKGTGNKTWRDRGTGNISILRHRENQRIRLLMRVDKTLKIILNQAVDPRVVLKENVGSDRSWCWRAFDYSEGELVEETFAIKFADSEIAKEFKEEYEKAQKDMQVFLEGGDKPGEDDGKAGDEAAKALEGLSTKDEEGK